MVPEVFPQGAESSNRGAKILVIKNSTIAAEKHSEKNSSPSNGGLACPNEGTIAPLLW